MGFFSRLFQRKSYDLNSRSFIEALSNGGGDSFEKFQENYSVAVKKGYNSNLIAYHCITSIAKAVSDIPYYLHIDGNEIESNNDVLTLLKRPNLSQSYKTFLRDSVIYRLISGNSYILGLSVTSRRGETLKELTHLRPDRVKIILNSNNIPAYYEYSLDGQITKYPIDRITQQSDVLHLKEANPGDDLYGLSPLSVAANAIQQINAAGSWNRKLLEAGGKPAGILTIVPPANQSLENLTQAQLESMTEQVDQKMSKHWKIPFFSKDVRWQSLGMSPSDMEWLNAKNTNARDICLAFGYPALLLGMPEGATFSNVAEAKLAFYEDTVIPLTQNILEELSRYLSNKFDQDIEVFPDIDKISALMPRRDTARKNARDDMLAGVITPNEAREENGYEPVEGGDELLVAAGKLPISFDAEKPNGTADIVNDDEIKNWLKTEGLQEKLLL